MQDTEQGMTTRQYRQEAEEGREGLVVSRTIVIKLAGLLLQGWQGDAVSVKWEDTNKQLYMQIYYTNTHTDAHQHKNTHPCALALKYTHLLILTC